MIGRRAFLGAILGACAAPAIVRADSLMRVVAPKTAILVSGELGQIDRFSLITNEMLRGIKSPFHLIGRSRPMPVSPDGFIRFRRYADTHLLVPRDISAELINQRKTA